MKIKIYLALILTSLMLSACTIEQVPVEHNKIPDPTPVFKDSKKETQEPKEAIEQEEQSQELSEMETQMIDLVNQERTKNNLSQLELDEDLREVARLKSKDLARDVYFAHQSPVYGSPFEMMQTYGIEFTQAGENLAGHQSVEAAHEGLMNSKGHRENILKPDFTHIGIGVKKSEKFKYVFTQMFITK